MSAIFRRCGCRDDHGKTYGVLPVKNATAAQQARACPLMSTDPKHGTFSWRLSRGFDPATGKRVQVNGGSFPTLKAAQTALNAAKVKRDQGLLAKPTQQTLATYGPVWLERRKSTGQRPLAPTTAAGYARYLRLDIAPTALGKRKLTDLRRSDVQVFVDQLAKQGRGPTTIRRILSTVQAILTGAVKDEIIPINVARGIETPTITKPSKQIWTPAEVAAFITTAREHRLGALFEVTLHAALRRGEVCGLRWSDVDLDRGEMTITNNRVVVGGSTVTETSPKTDASAAQVELSPAAVTALEVWRLRQDLERDECGISWRGVGHVFTMEDGRPVNPVYATRLFAKLVKQAGLPPLTLHGLRHLAASFMWDSTGDLLAVSKALRHSSPTVTAEVYTHMKSGKQRAMFDTIAAQLETAGAHTLHAQPAPGA